jgi:hypothetical protein
MIAIAREVGYEVHSMFFEGKPMKTQMAAGRYADVIVGSHGAALTVQIMMDASDYGCRTLLELAHWVNIARILHYQRTAYMVNNTADMLAPYAVSFGPSVRNPKKERRDLKSFKPPWSLNGFHDQTAYYSLDLFRGKLEEAMKRLRRCRGVCVPQK